MELRRTMTPPAVGALGASPRRHSRLVRASSSFEFFPLISRPLSLSFLRVSHSLDISLMALKIKKKTESCENGRSRVQFVTTLTVRGRELSRVIELS